ncbi:calcium-binding protein P [Eurytemora carolleeae]|uniref:calcium-binding protein P n=1 Tax=Eurytemora carolleeae TaxID=1294199 RepID=UPI000C7840CF|nr:calcium-binding protein P [Eurytemora carolleeae]|eukprot:XP_023336759.1 calcium-binding protein P-like [Eurytemora affinis]
MSTPSPMHGSNGPPGPGGLPPPHNTMTPTPPAQGHTPAPSPGPQILGYPPQGPHQPNMPQYHMMMIPSGAGLPQFHQGPGNPGMGGNQLVGQPNMPQHFQYIQQGGQPIHMMPQHHQQHGQHPQHQQHPQHHQHQQQQQ